MNRLDQFLSIAARQMRVMPAAKRDDELRELRGHLEQRAQDYESAGMSADEAQLRATEGLGSARALGNRLCDAWEGVPFGWWRLAAAIMGVTAFLLFGVAFVILAMVTIPLHSEAVLLPEIVPALCMVYIALPLFCGLLFSHWLGRRGRLVATVYFLALENLTMTFPASTAFAAPPANFVAIVNAAWFPYFWVALAWAGACAGHFQRTQMRYKLATVGAAMVEPRRVVWMRLNFKWWRKALLLTMLCAAIYSGRVWRQFHPQTPVNTLKNVLLTASPQGFDSPESVQLHELLPANAAERAGRQVRIHIRVVARAKPYFAASQIQHLDRQIASQKRTGYGNLPLTKAALARVKNNRQIVEGTVTMVKTSDGWRADEKSFDFTALWEWFYDR